MSLKKRCLVCRKNISHVLSMSYYKLNAINYKTSIVFITPRAATIDSSKERGAGSGKREARSMERRDGSEKWGE